MMAFYLVRALLKKELAAELLCRLQGGEIESMRPFGPSLHRSLREARLDATGEAVWEEEDYCRPPLAQEREAVLDRYFRQLRVEPVPEGEGWKQVTELPKLWPDFSPFIKP